MVWSDVALRYKWPGTDAECEGKVIRHVEQETYLIEWTYPSRMGGPPVKFQRQSGVREMRSWMVSSPGS